jgi:hypothetical protein
LRDLSPGPAFALPVGAFLVEVVVVAAVLVVSVVEAGLVVSVVLS